jgi:hypothetical protein
VSVISIVHRVAVSHTRKVPASFIIHYLSTRHAALETTGFCYDTHLAFRDKGIVNNKNSNNNLTIVSMTFDIFFFFLKKIIII